MPFDIPGGCDVFPMCWFLGYDMVAPPVELPQNPSGRLTSLFLYVRTVCTLILSVNGVDIRTQSAVIHHNYGGP